MNDINNYGDLFVKATGGLLWSYEEYGSYQGDYIAMIYKDKNLLIYRGTYGSCSGCDWLSDRDEVTVEDIAEYMSTSKPFLTIPLNALPDTIEDLKALLPANSRLWLDDEYHYKLENVLDQIKNPVEHSSNLDIVEIEAAKKGLI